MPQSNETAMADTRDEALDGLLLIDFDHARGPVVTMSWPAELQHMKGLEDIAFYALPDRIHERDDDLAAFHISVKRPHKNSFETVFGMSAIRRIDTASLIDKPNNVTRNTIQKAVVLLSSKPLFGQIAAKLKMATAAYFRQLSFEDDSILAELRLDIASAIESNDEESITLPNSVRGLIQRYRSNALVLFKALLLQRSILFYGAPPVERLVSQQYALLALVPGEISHMQNSASPLLPMKQCMEDQAQRRKRPDSLQQNNRKSLQRYLGLPLRLFENGRMFSPLVPLQHVELLDNSLSFFAGTTNTLIAHRRDCIKVNVDIGSIELGDLPASHLLNLTAADRKWMDWLCKTVNKAESSSVHFVGSDDWIVSQFEEYTYSLLAAVKEVESIAKGGHSSSAIGPGGGAKDNLSDFGKEWVSAWTRSEVAQSWTTRVDRDIFGICPPQHPVSGRPSIIEDFSLRIHDQLQHLHVTENLTYAKDGISSFLAAGSTNIRSIYGAAGSWGKEMLAKPPVTESSSDGEKRPSTSSVRSNETSFASQVNLTSKASQAFAGVGSFFSRSRNSSADGTTFPTPERYEARDYKEGERRLTDRALVTTNNTQSETSPNGIRTLRLASQTSPRPTKSTDSPSPQSIRSTTLVDPPKQGPKPLRLTTQSVTKANADRRRRVSSQTQLSETASANSEAGSFAGE